MPSNMIDHCLSFVFACVSVCSIIGKQHGNVQIFTMYKFNSSCMWQKWREHKRQSEWNVNKTC